MLNPAAELDYSPRVRELFANLEHAGSLPVSYPAEARHASSSGAGDAETGGSWVNHSLRSRTAPTQMGTVLKATVGSREQGASVQFYLDVRDARVNAVRYQAYGCPHVLAASESLAQWLEGRALSELSQWRWRDVEAELVVPASKRSRLLLLDEIVSALSKLTNA